MAAIHSIPKLAYLLPPVKRHFNGPETTNRPHESRTSQQNICPEATLPGQPIWEMPATGQFRPIICGSRNRNMEKASAASMTPPALRFTAIPISPVYVTWSVRQLCFWMTAVFFSSINTFFQKIR